MVTLFQTQIILLSLAVILLTVKDFAESRKIRLAIQCVVTLLLFSSLGISIFMVI